MRERYIEQQLVKAVRKRGGLCEKWNSGTAGWPDRIILFPDEKAAFCELKAPGEKPRKLQTHRHGQLRALGFKVYVIDNIGQIESVLDEIGGKKDAV